MKIFGDNEFQLKYAAIYITYKLCICVSYLKWKQIILQ